MKSRMKKPDKRLVGITISIITMFIVTVLLLPAAPVSADSTAYKARLSYHWGPKHYSAIMAEKFVEKANKATNGRLQIETFPQGQLFSIRQIVPALSQGSVDIGGVLGVLFMSVDKNYYFLGMQNLFSSFKQMRGFLTEDPVGRKYWEGIQNKLGIKILAYIPVGPACYFSTKKKLDTVDAFKGLKARTLIGTEKFAFKPLEINYVKVSTAEVYTALKSGMINTMMTVPSAMKGRSWWDFLKYGQNNYQLYADAYVAVNLKWWNSLPKDIQDILLTKVAPEISKEATNGVMSFSENVLKEFQKEHGGIVSTLSKAETAKFNNIMENKVYPAIGKNIDPELFEAVMKYTGRR